MLGSAPPLSQCSVRCAHALKGYLWVADPRQVTFLCLSKEKSPKERTPRNGATTPAHPRLCLQARATAHPCAAREARVPARAPSGLRAKPCVARARHYGDPKTPIWPLPFTDASGQQSLPIQHGQMGVVPTPVGASECCAGCANVAKARDGRERPAQRPQGVSRASCSSPRRVFCARRVRRALGGARSAGNRAQRARRSDRACFLSVPFFVLRRMRECRGRRDAQERPRAKIRNTSRGGGTPH